MNYFSLKVPLDHTHCTHAHAHFTPIHAHYTHMHITHLI